MQMLLEKLAPSPEQLARAAKLEEEARDNLRREEESFQRSDTDGFLSQWAFTIGAELKREQAAILKDGGYARFPVLIEVATGKVLATKTVTFATQYEPFYRPGRTVWRLDDADAQRLGRRWIPRAGSRKSRIQRQLGLIEVDRWFPAFAKITTAAGAASTGLAGCANAYVGVFKKGGAE